MKKIALFYKVLLGVLLVLLAVFLFIRFALLRPWLTRYEAAQPKHVSQEVFDDLFSRLIGVESMTWPAWRGIGRALPAPWRS